MRRSAGAGACVSVGRRNARVGQLSSSSPSSSRGERTGGQVSSPVAGWKLERRRESEGTVLHLASHYSNLDREVL